MASPELQTVLQMLAGNPLVGEPPVQDMRTGLEAMAGAFPPAPDVNVEPIQIGDMRAEWISSTATSASHVVLYLHGGGYVIGSLNTHRDLASRLGRAAGARALLIDYRLAPEHIHPAAVDDAVAAYRWLLGQGTSPDRVAIAGDSAGGGLTIAALVALRDAGLPLPAAGVCFSPWVDMEATGESMATVTTDPMLDKKLLLHFARFYLADGTVPARTPLASPIHADLRNLPPLLIQASRDEVLRDDAVRVAAKARTAGVDCTLELTDEVPHVWQAFAGMLPEGQQAVDRAGAFLHQRLKI
jgi:epsilon-lactone hydrolase